jgi:uncharacterized protein (DUF1778 family)
VIKNMAAKKQREPKEEKAEPKRRKAVRKDKVILIRTTEAQKQALTEAAEKAGLGISSWMLSVALREIQKISRAAGK